MDAPAPGRSRSPAVWVFRTKGLDEYSEDGTEGRGLRDSPSGETQILSHSLQGIGISLDRTFRRRKIGDVLRLKDSPQPTFFSICSLLFPFYQGRHPAYRGVCVDPLDPRARSDSQADLRQRDAWPRPRAVRKSSPSRPTHPFPRKGWDTSLLSPLEFVPVTMLCESTWFYSGLSEGFPNLPRPANPSTALVSFSLRADGS